MNQRIQDLTESIQQDVHERVEAIMDAKPGANYRDAKDVIIYTMLATLTWRIEELEKIIRTI